MLQLHNQTPFKAAIAVLPDRAGIDTLYVIVKATLQLLPRLALAEEQVPVTMADEYHGDPEASSLKQCSEIHIGKTGTDVLLTGHAWAPEQRPVSRLQLTMSVAERRKTLQISGDRTWTAEGKPGAPQPFVSMPLTWERAFGGLHQHNGKILAEERNPVGCGFAGKRATREMQSQLLPNLEDAAAPLQKLGELPAPACFAPVAPSWLPRRAFAGTYDAQWQRTRAPYLPQDFDPRFLQSAANEFVFDRYLTGGEPVHIAGVTPQAPIAFNIPAAPLKIEVTIEGADQPCPANLETLLIEPDLNRLCMTWRGAVPCDRKALKVEKVTVAMLGRSS